MINRKIYTILLTILMTGSVLGLKGQSLAVKTNLTGWAMLMPNIGAEVVVNERSSWDVSIYQSMSNGWLCDINATAMQVGYKYWFGRHPLDQFFLGVTAATAHYKAMVNDLDRRGVAIPAGLNVGYAWPMGRRWNLELSYGVGMTWLSEEVSHEGGSYRRYHTDITPTNIGINLSYLLR